MWQLLKFKKLISSHTVCRLQELSLASKSKCDASFVLPAPYSNDGLSSTNFVDCDSSELEMSSPVYSMNLKKGCFFTPDNA